MNTENSSFFELIIHYLDGTATLNEKSMLLQYLKENEENRKTFKDIKDIWSSTMSIYANDVETEIALDKFKTRIEKYQQKQRKHKKLLGYTWRVAAAVLVIIGFSYFMQNRLLQPSQDSMLVMNRVVMPQGYKGQVLLPDSTIVWLNSNSTLTYPETFAADNRIVKLTGEAYFDVVRNEIKPFIVQTGHMEVTVLGTDFSVSDYDISDNIETILRSGSVRVKFDSDDKEFILRPDEKISYSKAAHQINIEHVNAVMQTSWANDKLVFDNDKFDDVLQQLEKWYGIKIRYTGKIAKDIPITLAIRKESKEQIFRAISEIVPVTCKIEEEEIIITDKKR